jgi:predicted DCC family thiol-disulfide oxidoreductase YuxK
MATQRTIEIDSRHILLYDGDCGVCSVFADAAQRLDKKKLFQIMPYQAFPENAKQTYHLSDAMFERGLYLVRPDCGKVHHGVFALNRFFFHFFPFNVFLVFIYAIPVFLLAELLVYRLVAKHRSRISTFMGIKACAIRK